MSAARRTLLVCCLAVFCSFFGITGCLVMLRGMQEDFQEPIPSMTWIPSTYTLLVAIFVLLAGALAERHGRRRLFVAGCFGIGIGAAVVASTSSLPVAIAGQAVSGIGAAAVMANSLTLVTLQFPDARERAASISAWVGATGLGLAAGPVASGFLLDHVSWRVPFVLVAASMILVGFLGLLIPETPTIDRAIDVPGQVLSGLTIGCLVVGLLRGGALGFGDVVPQVLLAVAALAAVALVLVELRTANPILDVRLFGNRAYAASLAVGLAGLFGFVGSVMLQAQFAQRGLGYTPTETGVRLLLQVLPFAVVSYLSGRIVASAGPRATVVAGLGIAALGAGGIALLGADRPVWQLALLLGAIGGGTACAVAPSTSAALSSVALEHLGQATITVSAFRQVGAALGTSLLGSVMLLASFDRLPHELSSRGLPQPAVDQVVSAVHAGAARQASSTLDAILPAAFADAFGSGASLAYLVLAASLLVIGALGALFLPSELSPLLAPPPKEKPADLAVEAGTKSGGGAS